MPVVTLIDTPGAYPGMHAEEHNQAEAIAVNLFELSGLTVPVVAVVTGEGGSGGALAIGLANRILMLEHSVYSVISPEGCASILWRSADKVSEACEAMKMTAREILELGVVDDVIEEPLGGAHHDFDFAAKKNQRVHLQASGSTNETQSRRYPQRSPKEIPQHRRFCRSLKERTSCELRRHSHAEVVCLGDRLVAHETKFDGGLDRLRVSH